MHNDNYNNYNTYNNNCKVFIKCVKTKKEGKEEIAEI